MKIDSIILYNNALYPSGYRDRGLGKENAVNSAIFTPSSNKERESLNNLIEMQKAGIKVPAFHMDTVSFSGYASPLKNLIKKGKVKVKWSFYGGPLNIRELSTDHIIPRSKGGPDLQSNYVFCNAWQNSERSNYPLANYINWEAAGKYLEQFKGVKVGIFDGDKYIQDVLNSIQEALRSGR